MMLVLMSNQFIGNFFIGLCAYQIQATDCTYKCFGVSLIYTVQTIIQMVFEIKFISHILADDDDNNDVNDLR